MDFDKLNAMVDELNKNLSIVEENTKRIEEEKLNAKKEIFYKTLEYFANWCKLFKKCGGFCKIIKTNGNGDHEIWLDVSGHSRRICFGRPSYVEAFLLENYNPEWADKCFFTKKSFESEVMPTIQSIDYAYVERVLSEHLNEKITEKARKIEEQYNAAVNR